MAEAPRPKKRTVSDIRSKLLRPATTSHFEVFIQQPAGPDVNWDKFKNQNGLGGFDQDLLHLCCSETVLPGSSLATTEINNDYTGVTERHAYRRLFDDRIDLTFYVIYDTSGTPGGSNSYLPIRFFEGWVKYIANESFAGNPGTGSGNYSYRMRYPKEYYGGLSITKFERDYRNVLKYNFVNAYPISVSSIPVSYDASDLLKVTISFSYIRYYIDNVTGLAENQAATTPLTLQQQAQFNSSNLTLPGLEGAGALSTGALSVGGISQSVANSSGNTVDRRVEAGLPFVGRNVGPLERFSGI